MPSPIMGRGLLGDLLYEAEGKVIEMKRSPNGKFEQTVKMWGKFLKEEFSATYSLEAEYRSDGTGTGELNGSFTTKCGVKIAFTGIGNSVRGSDGSVMVRGASCFSCPPGRFAYLNGISVLWEADVDAGGSIQGRGWEWK